MKKTLMFAAAAVAVLGMASCDDCHKGKCDNKEQEVKIYTGFLPAADVEGVRYTLMLDYDDDHEGLSKGDYDMVETYVMADSLGYKDERSFKSEGDFQQISREGKNYLKLVEDTKGLTPGSKASPLYFYVESDSTLVMVNEDLQPSETPGLNYTLKLVK
ncbi:MAG: copper resistance protein NlpE N-terminal domain-containing protein [Muribaculaceae bacterium]|nr:copper resistance protein NlpE N-terminal domain-containing protein [Muribaculaceae bacterium]